MVNFVPWTLALSALASPGLARVKLPSLVPSESPSAADAPLYWCSWVAQGRLWLHNATASGLTTPSELEAYWRARSHEAWMVQSNETNVFANTTDPQGATREGWGFLFPEARKDLLLVLDNGWQNGAESVSHQLELSPTKFPSFASPDKAKALGSLAAAVTKLGWKGLGVWTAGGTPMGADEIAVLRDAGVKLLKFDGGDTACEQTKIARSVAPGLVVEHGDCGGACPLNAPPGTGGGRWPMSAAQAQAKALLCTDLFRTYDMVKILSVAEVLDRQSKLILVAHNMTHAGAAATVGGAAVGALDPPPRRLFGGSGEPVVTAALGGAIQPMRGNLRGSPVAPMFGPYLGESGPMSRQRQHREDEVTRLARWARIAPPFGVGPPEAPPALDPAALADAHNFSLCDDACVISHKLEGVVVAQGAPARVTRNGLALPDVAAPPGAPAPWVIATRWPEAHGRVFSVTTIGRQLVTGWVETRASVTLHLPGAPVPGTTVGVFGHYESLVLSFQSCNGGGGNLTMLAQDLAADEAQDVGAEVGGLSGGTGVITVPGSLIERVGLSARSREDDVSAPGLVLVLR